MKMKSNVKRISLKTAGVLSYVGLPLIPIAKYWGFFTTTNAQTTISGAVIICLICCIPVVKLLVKDNKLFSVNFIWVAVMALGILGMYVGEQLAWVGGFGIAGSLGGSSLISLADKVKVSDKEKESVEKVQTMINTALSGLNDNK